MELSAQKRLKDFPNPNAKIGFVIFYPFQFYVFKNVYEHLKDEAEFIIDGGRFFPMEPPPGLLEDCVSLLLKHGVRFRILHFENYNNLGHLAVFFSKYKVLVGLWMSGCLVIPQTNEIRKVHINYGAGKELTMFWTRHRNWDLYLCVNRRVHDIVKLYTWAEIVGYPKFDDWFNGEFDESFIAKTKSRLDSNKKTVLYLPTHGDLASIDELAEELKMSVVNYNVIVKVHYYTPREEPERMERLRHPGIILFQDDTDLLPLLKIADVTLSDNSSAIFDAILADKPIVVTDFLTKKYLDEDHKKIRFFGFRLPEGAITYSQSIEQKIKKDGSVVVLKKPLDFQNAVKTAIADERQFKDARKKLREELFAFNDGKCGERAASEIKKLVSLERLPEKPILYHVFEAEYQSFRGYSKMFDSPDMSDRKIMDYYSQRAAFMIKSLPFLKRIKAVIEGFF